MVLIQREVSMKVIYKTCLKCKYRLNPATEKLCLYCREKMPAYNNASDKLFTKGYKPKTFYGRIYKMFTKVYASPHWKINYIYGSFRKSAEIEIERGHYINSVFFDNLELCGGHVISLSNYSDVVRLTIRENKSI